MKRIVSFLLIGVLAVVLCSCGKPKEKVTADSFSNEQEQEITEFIEEKISAYHLNVFTYEKEKGLSISITAKQKQYGAENYFADILMPVIDAIKEAKDYFSLASFKTHIGFSVYKGSYDDDSTGMITFDTEDLEKGTFVNSLKNMVETKITVKEIIELLQ